MKFVFTLHCSVKECICFMPKVNNGSSPNINIRLISSEDVNVNIELD